MSKFLGPIHYWLHGKILRQEQLEFVFDERLKTLGNPLINDIVSEFNQQFGSPRPNESLEENIDQGNIHGWLQQRITLAETRFASKLTAAEKHQSDVISLAEQLYHQAGTNAAAEVKASGAYDGSLPVAYKLLNNYVLEGMPCDHAGAVVESSDRQFAWLSQKCLHTKYWVAAEGDVATHYKLRDAFSEGFFKALDALSYQRTVTEDGILFSLTR